MKTLFAVGALATVAAAAPLAKDRALALMHQRHEQMELVGRSMRAAKQGLDAGNIAQVRKAAAIINQLAPRLAGAFPAGTGPDVGKTHAKPEIWSQPQKFAASMQSFRTAAATFDQAARGGDLAALKAAHGNLGKTCGSCHDQFRAKGD